MAVYIGLTFMLANRGQLLAKGKSRNEATPPPLTQ